MRKMTWIITLLAALSFALMGCPKDEGSKEDSKEEKTEETEEEGDDEKEEGDEEGDEEKKEEGDEEKKEEGDDKKEEGDEEKKEEGDEEKKEEGDEEKMEEGDAKKEEAELPTREKYIDATVAIGCNDLNTKLKADEKTKKRQEIFKEFGFTDETYGKSQEKYKDDPAVKPVVAERVSKKACAEPKKAPVLNGRYKGTISGGGISGTGAFVIKGGKFSGNIRGKRSGESFGTSVKGSVKGNTISGTSSSRRKGTSLRFVGKVKGNTMTGTGTGKINEKAANLTFRFSK